MKRLNTLALLVSILALGACETMDGLVEDIGSLNTAKLTGSSTSAEKKTSRLLGRCPSIEIVEELSFLEDFSPPRKTRQNNLVSKVSLTHAENSCSYKSKSVTVDLELAFEGGLGPKAKAKNSDKPFFTYPFFVAVTAPNGDIMAKEIFAASMTYDQNENTKSYYEKLRQIIPIKNNTRGSRYKIMVGFQLSSDQLAHNRALIQAEKEARAFAEEQAKAKAKAESEAKAKAEADAKAEAEASLNTQKAPKEKPPTANPNQPANITILPNVDYAPLDITKTND